MQFDHDRYGTLMEGGAIDYVTSQKHAYIHVKPSFYIVKLRFTGVYINFLISAQKHTVDCGY